MASSIVCQNFICHFCYDEFRNRSSLLSHFSQCRTKNSTRQNHETISLIRLNKTDRDLLHMLKLHRCKDKFVSCKPKDKTNSYLQIPLSHQPSFDDPICSTNNCLSLNSSDYEGKNSNQNLNTKSSLSYHTYKYSRREQNNFYASVKRARLKKQCSTLKKSHKNSQIFNKKNYSINLPTKINSRQRLNTNANNSYPLIFDPHFHSLVQLSTNNLFQNYFSDIKIYFHLIHSIASQEFQLMINSNDHQQQVSYTAYSFINILRQTMTDYSLNLQKNLKRNYFQSFQPNNQAIPSNVQIDDNYHRFETLIDSSLPSEAIINNFLPIQTNEINNPVIHPVQSDISTLRQRRTSRERNNTEPMPIYFIPIVEEPTNHRSPSPVLLKKQKIEPIQNDQCNFIRIINGTNDNGKRSSSSKKNTESNHHIDENSMIKPTRMTTRKSPIKMEVITETNPSFETKPVILSSNEISKEWLTHNVFYRCHVCSHEEFFVVLSRECINLHISSKHANMEENFKQRLSNFLNSKGRSLKVFQHYLKWQQPWSEKQIEQVFKLSNKR
ncbi:unnamed protein product [Rotaria socialis]|uniref:Uncharacterized protein n=1 Tax=Rotaria socialis TaxID=392032 RepID=A0A820SR61_9BILA|nr:unnamed protein product [Rotaria socialis]CAF4454916.1 unnamed protein product [Rotaria socialis]